MATQLTPNLGLRLTDEMSIDDKYNLNKIDLLSTHVPATVSGSTDIVSGGNVYIAAKVGDGVSQINGNITIEAGNLQPNDTSSIVAIKGRTIILSGYSTSPEGVISSLDIKVDAINFNHARIINVNINEFPVASASTDGILTNEDWTRFNSASQEGSFISHSVTLSATDIANGYISLPTSPHSPTETLVLPEGAPNQYYGIDYTISGSILSFVKSSIWSMGWALESGDPLLVLYR